MDKNMFEQGKATIAGTNIELVLLAIQRIQTGGY